MLSPSQLSTYLRDNPQPLLVAVSQTSILQAALYFCLSLTKIRKGQDLDQITMENKYFKCNSVPVECQVFTCWWMCIRKSCFFWFWCWGWFGFFFPLLLLLWVTRGKEKNHTSLSAYWNICLNAAANVTDETRKHKTNLFAAIHLQWQISFTLRSVISFVDNQSIILKTRHSKGVLTLQRHVQSCN